MAEKGHALPDGSYPIGDTEDLHNAYTLAASGHGDVSAAKSLIGRRAKELGVANPFDKSDDAEKSAGPIQTTTYAVVTEKKGKLPKDDAKVTEALQEATEAQETTTPGTWTTIRRGRRRRDEVRRALRPEAPARPPLRRLHSRGNQERLPGSSRLRRRHRPAVLRRARHRDHQPGPRDRAVRGGSAKASTAYGYAVNLAKMDLETADGAREVLSKAFSEMYPSVHLTPGDIMPSQFRRPYISGGRANQTAKPGQKPRLPMSASTPDAANFDRGYLQDGRAANSPSAGGPNSASNQKISKLDCSGETHEVEGVTVYKITHLPTGVSAQGSWEKEAWENLKDAVKQRNFYTNNSRDQAAEVMTGMHDYIVAMHPNICPMAAKQGPETEPAAPEDAGRLQVDNRAGETPTEQAGYQKLETADIQKLIEAEVEKQVGPLKKKNKKLEKRAEEAEARAAEFARMADPELGVYRGGLGVIPFVPKREETTQGSEDQAEVEKREMVEWCLEKLHSPDQATSRQAMEKLQSLLNPDELAAALVKTG